MPAPSGLADPFAAAALFIERTGIAYLFGGTAAVEFPNLHAELTGRDTIEEWTEGTDLVWSCRGELPLRGVAWYGGWLRGRGTFVASSLLPAALGWNGRTRDEQSELRAARALSRDAGMLYEVLLAEGPLAAVELREVAGFATPAESSPYRRALRTLQRALLVTQYGSKPEGSSWPSAVYEVTCRVFVLEPVQPEEALSRLVTLWRRWSADPLDARRAARLFGATVDQVRSVW